MESASVHLGDVVVRDLSTVVSNYRSTQTLDDYLKAQGVPGIAGVDTRALTLRLRDAGCLGAVICSDASVPDAELVAKAKAFSIDGVDLIAQVTCAAPYAWKDPTGAEWEFSAAAKAAHGGKPFHVVALDFGVKHNILRR